MNIAADKLKDFGDTELLCCPRCKQMVNMKMLKSSSGVGLFGVSLYDYKIELFTICPACNAMFSVDPEVAQKAGQPMSNMYTSITEPKLTYVKDLKL